MRMGFSVVRRSGGLYTEKKLRGEVVLSDEYLKCSFEKAELYHFCFFKRAFLCKIPLLSVETRFIASLVYHTNRLLY